MPYKSRKKRRNISPNHVSVTASTGVSENITSTASNHRSASDNRPVRIHPDFSSSPRMSTAMEPVKTNFLYELKWITLVTVIVAALLVAAYYAFR
ncbi:MAG: hypothetical protein JXA46_17835 [Dehalococcoidales bacterium]|nr:hypothetical protein [Dehalococcoidales bacterium]